jgi:acetate kinase
MSLSILAVNGGSSSLKCALFEVADARIEPLSRFTVSQVTSGDNGHVEHLHNVLEKIRQDEDVAMPSIVGHRVVHGGDLYQGPVRIDAQVTADLRALVSLAPLHQPVNLELIEAIEFELPGVPQVACFDTAFHQRMPDVARNYALPCELTESGIHAYGFHGISYEYVWDKLQMLDADAIGKRVVILHLGAGASLCAIKGGHSIATTMGFSTLDGMPMATRPGSIDPGVLLHLMREYRCNIEDLEELLYRSSGLKGMSGISGGMIELSKSKDPRARAAIDYFVYRASREIGSLAGALGGLDTLVFTGGIGANDAAMRRDICATCEWLGVRIDEEANASATEWIGAQESGVDVWVIPTNEETEIARQALTLLDNAIDAEGSGS